VLRPNLALVVDTDDWEGWGGWNDLLAYPRSAKTLFAWQERDLPRRAAAVTVASRTLEAQVAGFGVPPERVFYLPNGVSSSELRVPSSEFRGTNATSDVAETQNSKLVTRNLLLYTRFWEFDVRDVVAALVGIVAGCPTARLLVVGRGERGEETELLRLAERAGVREAIDYRGWVEPGELPGLLASADVALVPMDDTLINRARGLAKLLELEDGRSGLLVAPGDAGALAGGALQLLADPELRARLGRAAAGRVAREYTWDHLAAQAEQAYELALATFTTKRRSHQEP
jgi:glycosyltransferase involved in cell wall biosynthesis